MANQNTQPKSVRSTARLGRTLLLAGVSTLATATFSPALADVGPGVAPVNFQQLASTAASGPAAQLQSARLTVTPLPGYPILSVGLVESDNIVVRGQESSFVGFSNYPARVNHSELRIFPAGAGVEFSPHAVVQTDHQGTARWTPAAHTPDALHYVYRIYDHLGRFDETAPQILNAVDASTGLDLAAPSRPDFGSVDSAAVRHALFGEPANVVAEAKSPSDALFIVSGTGFKIRDVASQTVQAPPVTAEHKIEVRADGITTGPILSVGLVESDRTVVRGHEATFVSYSNYPSFIDHGELRIFAAGVAPDATPHIVIKTDANGVARWTPTPYASEAMYYVYRVYDAAGHFDETKPEELTILDKAVKIDGPANARPNFGSVDETSVRNIPLNNAATVTVTGIADARADTVRVAGQLVVVDEAGKFVSQQIIDKHADTVRVTIDRGGATAFATTREIKVPHSDWFFVGQGDLTFISSKGAGPAVQVSGDPTAAGDHVTSRAAFYTKGQFGNGWKLTGSIDTGEGLLSDMFSNLNRKDPRQLLRRLNSNEYYTTYGDDSTLVEDAPTQGKFYLKLQKLDSTLLVGNFIANINQAELAQIDRGLFGAIVDHKSTATTSFGARKLELTAFASDPGTIPGRDEFRGTGGSLYFLKRQDLSIGSERVRVETRDRDTGIVLESHELRPQEDYDVDYFQGRITLLKPLSSTAADGSTVRQSSSAGNIPVLVVRYEYTPVVGDLKGYTIGSRGSAWLGDKLRVGVTAQRETTDSADQNLLGGDLILRIHAGTYLKGEVAQTTGPAFGQANSVDGGLSFTNITSPAQFGQKAKAYRVEGALDFAEMTGRTGDHGKVSGYYERFDAGFSANGQLTQSDTQRWGATAAIPIAMNSYLIAKYEELQSATAGTRRVASVDATQKFGRGIEAKLGVRHDNEVPGLLYNSTQSGARTDAALELAYKPAGANWSAYGFGQATLAHDAARPGNNRIGVGVKAEISDRTSISGEVSEGQGGLGADVHINRRFGQGSEAYIGYALLSDRTDTGLEPVNLFTRSNRGTLTVGARHRLSSALSIYGENRIGQGGSAPSVARSFGVKFDPSERLSFSGSFENGRIDDATTGVFRRTAATIGAAYTTKEVQLGSTIEARFEKGNGRDQKVWLFRNTASLLINPDWRALGRLNFAVANDDRVSVRAADYIEGVVGFAYRPVLNDRLNILARFNYFQDLGPVGQITSGGETASPKQRSKIVSFDVNYDLTHSLTIGGKYAYRQGQVSLGRTSDTFISSNTQLAIIRADLRITKAWDVLAEGRYLTNDLARNNRLGALVAVYRHVGNNVKVGAGYSFANFSDDLSDQSYKSKGFFINVLGKF